MSQNIPAHCAKYAEELVKTATHMVEPGKGLLAADESTGTIQKRFDSIKVENTEANRRAYRELLFTCEAPLENYVSGVIMYEETLYQSTTAGKRFVDVLKDRNIVTGIKIDKGVSAIAGSDGETSTQGLDGLRERCTKWYADGARFSKWRAVLKISKAHAYPSDAAIAENARGLARMAHISQECGLVPIIEPEVLPDGTHTIEECAAATKKVLNAVVYECNKYGVFWPGAILKPNMVMPGADSGLKATPEQVGYWTVNTLSATMPPALRGVMFLSGGQSEEEATLNLNAINTDSQRKPWPLSFSYGRALQQSVLMAWGGKPENVKAGQDALIVRAKANSEAQLGKYHGGAGGAAANASLAVKNYVY
jgi:fructose-bisphosphate aldolase class I